MPSATCGWCQRFANMQSHGETVIINEDFDRRTAMGAFACDYCRRLSVAWIQGESRNLPSHGRDVDEYINSLDSHLSWLPKYSTGKIYDDVPRHIAAAASEAHECFGIGALRAAVQLARSVVEATAKEKQITSGVLAAKIDAMHANGLIRPHVKEAAHEIRYLGNEMAHGDFISPVSKEEAEEVLGLMDEVLLEVFQSPARVERRRNARLSRGADADTA